MGLLVRLVRIRWVGFGHTRHWLEGAALIDYLFRETLLPSIAASFEEENLLIRLTEGAQ